MKLLSKLNWEPKVNIHEGIYSLYKLQNKFILEKMKKRKIAVFTGNRAEYGLQFPVLRAIDKHPELTYKLIVSGAHLDNNFGRTLKEIKEDGFKIEKEIKIEIDSETLFSTAQAIGSGIKR